MTAVARGGDLSEQVGGEVGIVVEKHEASKNNVIKKDPGLLILARSVFDIFWQPLEGRMVLLLVGKISLQHWMSQIFVWCF